MTIQANITQGTAGLRALIARLQAELRTNRRSAIGSFVIFGLLALYGLSLLDDAVNTLRTRYAEESHRLNILSMYAQESEWPQRAAASAKLRQSLEARLWKSENDGMARADIQDWMSGQAREAGLQRVQINLDSSKSENLPDKFRKITATLTAQYTESSLLAFLDRISRDSRFLIVDHLLVREKPIASMELKLTAFSLLSDNRPAVK